MTDAIKLKSLPEAHCKDCSLAAMCLPLALQDQELDTLDSIVKRGRPLRKGEMLFRQGDPFDSLYALRSGTIKTFTVDDAGVEQITGFHFPGDIIGFDALRENKHQSYTSALETAMVCELPYETLDEMSVQFPKLRHQIMSFMSAEIKQDHDMIMLLNKRTAEERLLYFISLLSQRFEERGFSHREFHLTMTRNEIGNYLGLTIETISRLLSRFQKDNIIKVDGKLITILDFDRLNTKLAALNGPSVVCG